MEAYDKEQTYFDNIACQREYLEASCNLLRISWQGKETVFRVPGMALSA